MIGRKSPADIGDIRADFNDSDPHSRETSDETVVASSPIDDDRVAPDDLPNGDTSCDEDAGSDEIEAVSTSSSHGSPRHRVAYLVLPLVLMLLAAGTGYLKYEVASATQAQREANSTVQAATDGTIALLSYDSDTARSTLTAARDRLTGSFKDSYTSLTNDVVIPGAQEKKISASATVPAASSMSVDADVAVVLVFVDQSVTVGNDAPSTTASVVQVTLENADGRWLISGFDPK